MKTTHYRTGFTHGVQGIGTNGYRPLNRTAKNKAQYDLGFAHGMRKFHDETAPLRAELAKLNEPKTYAAKKP